MQKMASKVSNKKDNKIKCETCGKEGKRNFINMDVDMWGTFPPKKKPKITLCNKCYEIIETWGNKVKEKNSLFTKKEAEETD